MVGKSGGARFSFMDAFEVARRLGIDRVTLDMWVKEGRIRPHRGVGRDVFFRSADVEALYNELHPASELAEALAADEKESLQSEQASSAPVQKKQEPQMRVYLRLQADTKWYDVSENDIRLWFQQLAPDGYERNKRNVEHVLQKLTFLKGLLDDGLQRESELK